MREYKNLTPYEIADRLCEIENPVIFIHTRADGDCIGSAAALSLVLLYLGKSAPIATSEKIPERLKFILEYTGVKVSEYKEGKMPISIDVASPAQLGKYSIYAERVALMIDHHEFGGRFADGYIDKNASSAAEVLFDIVKVLQKRGLISLTKPLAYALYAAMSSDTGCFSYSNTSPKTYRYAAELVECGIDHADINMRLFRSKTQSQIKAEGIIARKLKTENGGRIAYASVTASEREELGLSEEDFDTAIDVIRSTRGVSVALFVRELSDGRYKASMRSTGANVAIVAEKFGGGGHIRAAACALFAESIDDAAEKVLEILRSTV